MRSSFDGRVSLEENMAVTWLSAALSTALRMPKIGAMNALPIKPITNAEAGRLIEAANCDVSVG